MSEAEDGAAGGFLLCVDDSDDPESLERGSFIRCCRMRMPPGMAWSA